MIRAKPDTRILSKLQQNVASSILRTLHTEALDTTWYLHCLSPLKMNEPFWTSCLRSKESQCTIPVELHHHYMWHTLHHMNVQDSHFLPGCWYLPHVGLNLGLCTISWVTGHHLYYAGCLGQHFVSCLPFYRLLGNSQWSWSCYLFQPRGRRQFPYPG